MLKPGLSETHRAYLWSYCTMVWNDINAVVFDFTASRTGRTTPVASWASVTAGWAAGAARSSAMTTRAKSNP
ncbi:hypothetical protein [Acidovorax sp. BLS4]|uniref:hypothetical protein n=1 Tax=Acidovorax sp. BLS4 TaxID=3273430 RepID=UPI00355BDFAD